MIKEIVEKNKNKNKMGFGDYKPTIFMLLMQFTYAGLAVSTRASLLQGMSPKVFVVYRQSIATLLIFPIAFLSRKHSSCHLTWKSFGMIFLISLIGVTINQNIYFEGLYLASSSMASALGNVLPAVTFLVAYMAGMEKIKIRSLRSIAKIAGTIICVTGAVSMVLLKGPKLLNMELLLPPKNLLFNNNGDDQSWLLGCFLLFASNFCWSIWLILQVPVSACYPDHLSLTGWTCCLAALQSACFTLFTEDLDVWKLNSYKELSCCIYAGAVSGIAFFTQAWCISRRGPLFSAVFNPLGTVLVIIFATILLHEEMYTGSLVGAIAVIFGLYIVLWGKAKDNEKGSCIKPQEPNVQANESEEWKEERSCKIDLEEPLLHDKVVGINES